MSKPKRSKAVKPKLTEAEAKRRTIELLERGRRARAAEAKGKK